MVTARPEDLIRADELTVAELAAAEELAEYRGALSYLHVVGKVGERRAGVIYRVALAIREERDGPNVGVDPRRVFT